MGIGKKIIEFEEDVLRQANLQYSQIHLCEMGSQEYKVAERMPAKEFYEKHRQVKEHVSFDLNNKWGALPYDLTRELPHEFYGHFDVVTNYGTGEHIENQFAFYVNCHRLCKQTGIMIHFIPYEGFWPGHGRYYFNQQSIWDMTRVFNYEILSYKNVRLHDDQPLTQGILVGFLKSTDEIPSLQDFSSINIIDTRNTSGTGVMR